MGSGAFEFVEHVQGSHWVGKRFEGYFKPDRPYLDGFKAYFVKSTAVIPGLLGGQFDAEFRFRTPPERDLLVEKLGDKVVVYDQPLIGGNIFIFNTRRKPFDDIRVRQALTMAVDRWTGGENIGKISSLRYVGGVNRPGSIMALPEAELAKLPGYWKDAEKSRARRRGACSKRPARRAWPSNFSIAPASRATRLEASTPSTNGAASASKQRTNSSRPSSIRTTWRPVISTSGMEFISDYLDDPTQNFVKFLSKKLTPLGYSGHDDTKIDDLYERQRGTLDPVERAKIVRELDKYVLTTAYSVPFLWSQRIVVLPKTVEGWHMTPSHYLSQDLVDVWLDGEKCSFLTCFRTRH